MIVRPREERLKEAELKRIQEASRYRAQQEAEKKAQRKIAQQRREPQPREQNECVCAGATAGVQHFFNLPIDPRDRYSPVGDLTNILDQRDRGDCHFDRWHYFLTSLLRQVMLLVRAGMIGTLCGAAGCETMTPKEKVSDKEIEQALNEALSRREECAGFVRIESLV